MTGWIAALAAHEAAGTPSVLVTLLAARGSVPREAGAKMLVDAGALHGSIGGGRLEYAATAIARDLLAAGATGPAQREFPLGPALGQCCGGHATLLFEPMRPAEFQLALFGAGHVGQAVARLLEGLPWRLHWWDSRPDTPAEWAPQPAAMIAGLPAGCHVLVMTHCHAEDFAIIAAALPRAELGSIGLIGSATKRASFLGRLRRAGLAEAALARLECPIGLPGIPGKRPAEIAIGVVARLLGAGAAPAQVASTPAMAAGCAACAGASA